MQSHKSHNHTAMTAVSGVKATRDKSLCYFVRCVCVVHATSRKCVGVLCTRTMNSANRRKGPPPPCLRAAVRATRPKPPRPPSAACKSSRRRRAARRRHRHRIVHCRHRPDKRPAWSSSLADVCRPGSEDSQWSDVTTSTTTLDHGNIPVEAPPLVCESVSTLCNMPVGFENSAMKMSFSLSSLPPSSASLESPEHVRLTVERPYNSLTKKPRRDPEQETWRRSWGSRDENKDEFWAALQSNYNYLMDNHLIDSCKEANGELSWDEQDVSQRPWTFNEFLSQFSELYSWLNNIQETVYGKEENVTDRNLRLSHMEEIQRRSYRRKLFNDQAGQLMQRYPDVRDEVMWRVSHLNSKWEMLQQAMSPGKSKPDQRDVCTDVEHELRCLRKWIREMEARLQPLDFHVGSNWSPQELEEKAREHLLTKERHPVACHEALPGPVTTYIVSLTTAIALFLVIVFERRMAWGDPH
uniref:Uncharacterized protein n=1 Tax=Timema monikensis TaxID=170555 RepID=A0A7R9HRI5_9NEOP|nr:unnamed protein product [Timema monikensis]